MTRRFGIDMAFGVSLGDHLADMKAHGLSFAIFRRGQGTNPLDNVAAQVSAAEGNGIPYGFYYPIWPAYDPIPQVDKFVSSLVGYNPKSLWLDDELHGTETPEVRNMRYLHAYQHLKSHFPNTPIVGTYSGRWFVEGYCPGMKTWLKQAPYWDASYPTFKPQSWEEFAVKLAALRMPVYPAEYPAVRVWQFAGTCSTPMVPHGVDYNLIDDDALFAYLFQGGSVPPVIPSERYRVWNPTGMYIRSTPPGGAFLKVKWVPVLTQLLVTEKRDGWGFVGNGWVNLFYCVKI